MVFSSHYRPRGALLAFAMALMGLGGCGGSEVVYRNLADIPDRPQVTPKDMNDKAVQNLTEERAKAMEAGENLRRESVTTPAPAPPPPDP
jgi:hypothetical protein